MLCELHKLKISEKYNDSLIKNTYFKSTFLSLAELSQVVYSSSLPPFQLNGAKRYIWWISTTGGIRTRTCRILSSIPLPLGYCGIWCGDVRNQPPRLVFCPYFCYTRLIAPIASISLVTLPISGESGNRTHSAISNNFTDYPSSPTLAPPLNNGVAQPTPAEKFSGVPKLTYSVVSQVYVIERFSSSLRLQDSFSFLLANLSLLARDIVCAH